ncbi:hypothetical protein D3C73_1434860 [compost metagenome]
MDIYEGAWKKDGISSINNSNFTKHLADHNLDMFIVDFYPLVPVYALNFLKDIVLYATYPLDSKHFLRIDRSFS